MFHTGVAIAKESSVEAVGRDKLKKDKEQEKVIARLLCVSSALNA